MLAVYFHHDSSVLTNVFCTQALCADSVCSFLNENFVNFGWDLTFSANKTRAVNMITKHFGSVAASTLKNMDIERLPLLVLIYKLRGSTEIFQVSIIFFFFGKVCDLYSVGDNLIYTLLICFCTVQWVTIFFNYWKKCTYFPFKIRHKNSDKIITYLGAVHKLR